MKQISIGTAMLYPHAIVEKETDMEARSITNYPDVPRVIGKYIYFRGVKVAELLPTGRNYGDQADFLEYIECRGEQPAWVRDDGE